MVMSAGGVHPYGDDALLLRCEPDQVRGWHRAITKAALPHVHDVIPGAASIVVRCDAEHGDVDGIAAALRTLAPAAAEPARADETVVDIPVIYDGEDLAEVAELIGRTITDVIYAHCAQTLEVAFCGFSPGFAYLTGLPEPLHVPRRTSPRARVPAGAVAIAAGYSAVYPQSSPGGWWLIGHTPLLMWDVQRDPPALLRPGDRVRFQPMPESSTP